MLATPAPSGAGLPRGPESVDEVTREGVRVLAGIAEIAEMQSAVQSAVLDGEVVMIDPWEEP